MKEQNCLRRFLFEQLGVRGEWVRLQESWQQTKQHQQLPSVVEEQLGQAMVASVLLSATIKFEGSLIIQAQGAGALKTLVAQSTHDRNIRGLVRSDGEATGSFSEMLGDGKLVITVEPKKGEPYQGIVPIVGKELADVITSYFLQSEQLETKVWLFANETQAAGLLLQELPSQKGYKEDWERIIMLADTITKNEMLSLDCEDVLFRLFNEEKVRVFDAAPVEFKCTCSRQKIENTLLTLAREELNSIIVEKENIEVDCEFCGEQYQFDKVDVESLLIEKKVSNGSETRH